MGYQDTGYEVFPGALRPDQVAGLKQELYVLIERARTAGQRVTAFDKVNGSHDRDPLFLDSGDTATVFHEPTALSWTGPVDAATWADAVGRVGHGLHAIPGPVRDWLAGSPLGRISRATGRRRPAAIESMYVRKSRWAEPLPAHLDHTYLWTDPPSVQVFWIALDRTGADNGGLLVDPRGPRPGSPTRLVRDGDEATIIPVAGVADESVSLDQLRLVECEPGDLVLVDGLLLHGSDATRGAASARDALAIHVVDLECEWSPRNYLGHVTPFEI
jgi:phytanoyl-CoA hydroxylase